MSDQPIKTEEIVYKDIPGFPGYRAGSDGSVWSCWKRGRGSGYGGQCTKTISCFWKCLKGEPRKEDGRLRYTLRNSDGTYRRAYGSHFILMAFVGLRPDGLEACHKDGNCLNDSADNLRWDTTKANKGDMVAHGTRLRGERINTAKITEDIVREIRSIGYPLKQHADRFGITQTLVSYILRHRIWKHVE